MIVSERVRRAAEALKRMSPDASSEWAAAAAERVLDASGYRSCVWWPRTRRRDMSARASLQDAIDGEMPFRGPCGLCGGRDARHRMLDSVAEMVRAGDSAEGVADDYGLSVELVARVAAEWTGDET